MISCSKTRGDGGLAAIPPPRGDTLHLDIETFSSTDLNKAGVYRYCDSPDFEILLLSYSLNEAEVKTVDLACGGQVPAEIIEVLRNPATQIWAHNSNFERICLSKWLGLPTGEYLQPDSWRCTMVWAAYLGLPLSLVGVGAVLGLEKQKLEGGKELIRYFCKPCKPTKANGKRIRNRPHHDPEKWVEFRRYNRRDVEAEIEIYQRLQKYPMPEKEWEHYRLDQEINDRGIMLDMDLVRQAILLDNQARVDLIRTMGELTGLQNPNSISQLKGWLEEQGVVAESLDKEAVLELLEDAPRDIAEVLGLRQSLAKSSVKKYTAMKNAVCSDGRVRGLIQFYGANRTGRFAGRLVQVQNLPRNNLPDLGQARALVKLGDYAAIEALYDSVPPFLSELIRTAFVPKPGHKFIVADFSAIEARVIAWLARETWRNEVFAGHGKIYEASASQMFGVPLKQITKDSPLRQKGKIAELALGYGGSTGALTAMGALQMGVAEDELGSLVRAWRAANPNIVRFWWAVDAAAITAVRERTMARTHGIAFAFQSGMLFVTLPSGRKLSYVKPMIGMNRFGGESVTFEGVGMTKKWERIETYGAKLAENITQAISRDLLCEAMQRLTKVGHSIVMHVHDEVVIETGPGVSVDEVCRLMAKTPIWAEGLLLRVEGFECDFYRKD